jgi:hypothetical protein
LSIEKNRYGTQQAFVYLGRRQVSAVNYNALKQSKNAMINRSFGQINVRRKQGVNCMSSKGFSKKRKNQHKKS